MRLPAHRTGHDDADRIFSIASSRRATPELFALGSLTTVVSAILLGAVALVVYGSNR